MPVKTARLYTLFLMLVDAASILLAFTAAYILRVQLDNRPLINEIFARDYLTTFLVLLPFWIIIFWSLGLYSARVYQKRLTEYGKLLVGSFIGILIVLGFAFVIAEPVFPARLVAVYAFFITFILLLFGREVLRICRELLFRFGIGVQRVMIVGSGEAVSDIARNMNNTHQSGYKVVALAGNSLKLQGAETFRSLGSGLDNLKKLGIDTIIQTDLYSDAERNQRIMNAAQELHIQYCFIPGESEFYSGKNQIDVFLGYPIISVYQTPLVGWGEVAKRIFDLILVVLTLPLWGGLILLLALLQKIFNPGPVFYKSARLTRYSKRFSLYKFRSMSAKYGLKDAAEEFADMGRDDLVREYKKNRKVENDPRITAFGKFLRATSLDEVPQLINVLIGDISLVGPRPILPQEIDLYQGRGALLHSVKSGLTGLWQVSGRSTLSFQKRVDLELYYAQNWSFWLDIKILFKTVGVVLFRTGAK